MTRVYEYVTWCTIYKYISQVRKISLQVHEHFVTPIHKSPKECKINHSNHAIFPPLKHTIWDHFQYKCLICPWPHAIHKTEDHIQSQCNKCKVMAVCSPKQSRLPWGFIFPSNPFMTFSEKKEALSLCVPLSVNNDCCQVRKKTRRKNHHTQALISLFQKRSQIDSCSW